MEVKLIVLLSILIFFLAGCHKVEERDVAKPASNEITNSPDTSGEKSELTKEQESRQMPLPGQVNDHSTLDPNDSQKSHK